MSWTTADYLELGAIVVLTLILAVLALAHHDVRRVDAEALELRRGIQDARRP